MGIKFDKDPLSVEQNNYTTKSVNVYMVYDLNSSPKNPNNNFKFKNCLFGATSVTKNSDKEKYLYCGYGITFDSAGSWKIDNDSARNVKMFGVDDSLSSHSDIRKNNFLVLGEGSTFGINGSFSSQEKKFGINFSKANTKFCLTLQYNVIFIFIFIITVIFINGKEIFNFKSDNKILNFQLSLVSESYLILWY